MNGQGESDASYDDIIMQLGGEGDLSKSHLQDDNNHDNIIVTTIWVNHDNNLFHFVLTR